MLKWLIRNRLAAFEREFGYDVSYMRHVLDVDTRAFLRVAKIAGFSSYRKDVPREVYYAVKIVGALAEDCGPCTQLVVTMGLKDRVDPRVLATVLDGTEAKMPDDVRLGVRFARAVLAHDPAADDARDEIVERWGERAMVSLAFALTSARIYPTLKYALGHGKACQRVVVGDETIAPVHRTHATATPTTLPA
jgi:hypothetical protein